MILCDVKLPDSNGVDFIQELKLKYPFIEIILLTAFGSIHDGVQAMKNGAFDYLVKGDDNDKIIPLLNKAIEKGEMQKRMSRSQEQHNNGFQNIIGTSGILKDAVTLTKKVAGTDATVLLLGETGTGKEVFAHAIHNASTRRTKPFLALNCSSFSKELLESEIFGYKSGAFTGALKDKKGLIEEANGGTLLLDEIGEMPYDLQSKLLRVLETSEFIKVGDTKQTKIDVRFIAATNRDIKKQINEGKFREDLFYRLNTFTIELPPLRDRQSDIPLLANYYLSFFAVKSNKKITGFTKEAARLLQQSEWKGNIRELKNTIERAVILEDAEQITKESLPYELQSALTGSENIYDLTVIEKQHIRKVLQHTNGNKTETARLLNIGLTTLYRKMEEYNISK